MKFVSLMAALVLGAAACSTAVASYPEKPIRMVVGFAPGGSADVNARLAAITLSEILGKPVVVENRPGASGMIAVQAVARSEPDGHTLLFHSSGTHVITPHLVPVDPDPIAALEPVARIGQISMVVLSNAENGDKSIQDLAGKAKKAPGDLIYGSPGIGTTHQLVMELILQKAGAKMTHVGYKGSAPGLQDLAAGRISYMVDTASTAKPFIDSNRAVPLAVTTAKRSELLPDVPSLTEAGFDVDASLWLGVSAPKGTPPEVLQRLNTAINEALDASKHPLREKLAASGWVDGGGSSSDFGRLIESESKQWKKVIETAGVTVN
ncbi:MAG: tripartite tricarboxylate transporter substrate binding protein [Alcaligenaceae bacterium]|nr:tripartite tricarboxylate transporter substrate binding protein [Alcaligenaceae bacterium]